MINLNPQRILCCHSNSKFDRDVPKDVPQNLLALPMASHLGVSPRATEPSRPGELRKSRATKENLHKQEVAEGGGGTQSNSDHPIAYF